MFKQTAAVTKIIFGNIPEQLGSAIVTVIGVAGVVGVLITLMSMGQSFQRVLSETGRPTRAIILSKGAAFEGSSNLSREVASRVMQSAGIQRSADGTPLASAEVLVQLQQPLRLGGSGTVSLRGVGPTVEQLRPELRIAKGRSFRRGSKEVIVGSALSSHFKGVNVGDSIQIKGEGWPVVGVFEHGGGSHDSEIIADAAVLQSVYHRGGFQSVTAQVGNNLRALSDALDADTSLAVETHREDLYYAERSKTISRVFTAVGLFVGTVMAVGAIFAAINTMYSAVASQARLIATLRAIGFRTSAIMTALFLESIALALAGAILGVAVSSAIFDGHVIAIAPGAQAQLLYSLHISSSLALLATLWAIGIGMLGGLFPAVHAARLQVAEALRIV